MGPLLYFLAEDLFREIIKETEDHQWTPGEVYSLVEKKIDEIIKCLNNRSCRIRKYHRSEKKNKKRLPTSH